MKGGIVIGASAGALEALSVVLPALPAGFACPVFVVVHVPPDRESLLANLLQSKCGVPVKEAEDKEPIVAGTVYLAPPGYHLLVETVTSLALSSDEAVMFSRPSIDVLFETAADAYGPDLTAVVLTGANEDGSAGALAVENAGGTVLIQDPAAAVAAAMPLSAIRKCAAGRVMSLNSIAAFLKDM